MTAEEALFALRRAGLPYAAATRRQHGAWTAGCPLCTWFGDDADPEALLFAEHADSLRVSVACVNGCDPDEILLLLRPVKRSPQLEFRRRQLTRLLERDHGRRVRRLLAA